MKFLVVGIMVFFLASCEKARIAVVGVDIPRIIDNYKPITPILVGQATSTVVSVIKLSNRVADDTAHAIIKELCTMEQDYRAYWINRQWRINGIDYRRACDSLDGEITEQLK